MAGPLRTILRRTKDAALGAAARAFLNSRLRGIGEVTDLSIDTAAATLSCRVQLVGERQPIGIDVGKYRLTRRGDRATIVIDEAVASREWLTAALQSYVVGRPFDIPPAAAASLASSD